MSGAGGSILFLFPWNLSVLFSRGRGEVASPVVTLSSAGYLRTDRVAHERVRVASGCSRGICPRASAARNFSIGTVGHRLGAFSPPGREASGSCPGPAALGPGGSCLPLSPSLGRSLAAAPGSGSGRGWRDLCPPNSRRTGRAERPLHAAFMSGFFCAFIAETSLFLQWLCRGLWHLFFFENEANALANVKIHRI